MLDQQANRPNGSNRYDIQDTLQCCGYFDKDMGLPSDPSLPPSVPLSPIPPVNASTATHKLGRFVVHQALPPVGQPAATPPPQQKSACALQALNDATYLEILEHDILTGPVMCSTAEVCWGDRWWTPSLQWWPNCRW